MSLSARAVDSQAPPLHRSVFPIAQRWAYCNHAAVGPLPKPAHDAILAVLDAQMYDGCAGILDVESHLESVRTETAAAIGATADEVAFMRSTSDGALVAANGIDWHEGDEIILPDNEFGANAYPWLNLRHKGVGVRFVRAPLRMSPELLETMKTPRTRLVAVSYVSFLDGYRHDLPALGRWCRDNGVLFAVDAMQGFGHLPLDISAWCIDFCYCGVAKWLLSPQGLSVVYVREALIDSLRPALCSWRSVEQPMNFLDYGQRLAPGARRLEGGTVNYPALMGFRESLRLLREASFEAIESHVLALCEHLINGAREHGIEVRSDTRPAHRSGIVLLGLNGKKADTLNASAFESKVGITVRENGVRVSPHGYNTVADMDAVLAVLTT